MGQKNKLISEKNAYGNFAVYSPDNILMFYANQNKLNFYIKNNLIEKLNNTTYRLTFTPNGLGYSADNNIFGDKNCLIQRENKCVVSGDTDVTELSKHHIVPRFFRKHFPSEFKSSFQTVVLVRRDIHSEYTIHEQAFYDILAEKYGVPNYESFRSNFITPKEMRLAKTLYLYGHEMPKEVKEDKELQFQHLTHLTPTHDVLEKFVSSEIAPENKIKTPENDFGCAIASKITDFREFELLWLNHFIEYAKPKFLPLDLIKSYDLQVA